MTDNADIASIPRHKSAVKLINLPGTLETFDGSSELKKVVFLVTASPTTIKNPFLLYSRKNPSSVTRQIRQKITRPEPEPKATTDPAVAEWLGRYLGGRYRKFCPLEVIQLSLQPIPLTLWHCELVWSVATVGPGCSVSNIAPKSVWRYKAVASNDKVSV